MVATSPFGGLARPAGVIKAGLPALRRTPFPAIVIAAATGVPTL
ncbi:hypothetical protein [Herbidospora mongoliensis]|nr:hypothetical protein [Herbidospora mongoliensis]